ncbi:MAG: FHA domain-containing protein [Armatimonadota bacterium]
MPQCPTCGSEVAADAEFCPDCGTDLQSAPTTPAAPAPAAEAPAGAETGVGAAAAPPPAPELAPTPLEAPPADALEAPAAAPSPAAPSPAVPGAAAGGARLTLKRGGGLTSEVFPVGGRAVIGRFDTETGPVDVDMGALPESSYVSRHHAEVWPDASGQWKVRDLGSRNGTFVRPAGGAQFQKVEGEQPLTDGDEIALGNARFEFRVG